MAQNLHYIARVFVSKDCTGVEQLDFFILIFSLFRRKVGSHGLYKMRVLASLELS